MQLLLDGAALQMLEANQWWPTAVVQYKAELLSFIPVWPAGGHVQLWSDFMGAHHKRSAKKRSLASHQGKLLPCMLRCEMQSWLLLQCIQLVFEPACAPFWLHANVFHLLPGVHVPSA